MSSDMKSKTIPEGFRSITPHLVVKGAAQAIEFYARAFGAQETERHEMHDAIVHASVRIGDSILMLNDEFPDAGLCGPSRQNASPVTIHIYVDDVDTLYERAIGAGATVSMPLANTFWGDRYAVLEDPYGHRWSIATHIEDVPQGELETRAAAAFAGEGAQ